MPSADVRVLSNIIRHMKNAPLDPLTPLIDAYLLKREASAERLESFTVPLIERHRPGGRLSPSSIGGCQRQAIFKFLGVDGYHRLNPDTQITFDKGNWIHAMWDARFYDMERVLGKDRFKVVGIEKSVEIPELYIAGSYDALIKIGGKLYLIDFKSINTFGFTYVLHNQAPREEHVKQLVAYCVARGIRRGVLLYDHKDSPAFQVFVIEWTEEHWSEVESWCNRALTNLERRRLPGRHSGCNEGTFLYDQCPFAKHCFGPFKDRPEKLRALAFRNFVGLDEAWELGRAEAS